MFNAPSFFAGVAAVLGILIFGFGGGVLMSSILLDNGPREPNKIERRAAEDTKPPVVATKPAAAVVAPEPVPSPVPAAQPTPPPAPAAQPTPAPPVQQATAQPQPPAPPAEPQPAPQVRRVDLPPPPAARSGQAGAPAGRALADDGAPGAAGTGAAGRPPQSCTRSFRRRAARGAQEGAGGEETRTETKTRGAQTRRTAAPAEHPGGAGAQRRPRSAHGGNEAVDDDDDRDERPAFRRERETPFGRPFFRMFGGDDD